VSVPDHDALYHRLFSHPGMVAQLLREFVDEPWVDELELAGMERISAKFHASGGERRDSDVIWRIPRRDGGDAYLLLLLEFQSRSDHWMALRVRPGPVPLSPALAACHSRHHGRPDRHMDRRLP
jgi:hypothetical protein